MGGWQVQLVDLAGQTIEHWYVIRYAEKDECRGQLRAHWVVECIRCRTRRVIRSDSLRHKPPACSVCSAKAILAAVEN